MKTRAKFILSMTASALILLAPEAIYASETTAPAHASSSQSNDTVSGALMRSVNDLSKTAVNLSEAVLKLLNSQNNTPASSNATNTPVNPPVNSNSPVVTTNNPISVPEAETKIETTQAQPAPAATANNSVFISSETDIIESETDSVWFLPAEKQAGGRYMWIPDEDVIAVKAILNGKAQQSDSNLPDASFDKTPDLNELTYWHGDSIHMALPTKRLGRFDRKLYNWLIYPKGLWHIGLTANYGELSTEDSEFLSLVTDVDLKGKIYSIKPSVSYFLRNNLCVGMRLAFTRGEMAINSFNVDIDEDMSFDLHDIAYTSDSYSAAIFLQQYFGLSRRGRFAVFNEVEVAYGNGSNHFIRPFDGQMRDTRTNSQNFNINYSPGVSIMMMKNAAFNLSFGIFGFHLKNEKQWENGEESGSRFTSGINFRFNIFNINFGVAIII